MRVDVRYFASLREALGASESIDVAEAITVGDLRDVLIALGGRHAEVLSRGRLVRAALNRTLVAESTPVGEGDEVGFFPPVTGG